MKLLSELVNQADLKRSDGSDAGKNDLDSKGAEVKFNLMRNTINSDGKITGSDVANYLEKAADLNDEVDTVLYGLETDDGQVVKVYVNAAQADAFEQEMKIMLGMEDDIEEAVNKLASKFDIVDVIWPKDTSEEGEGEGSGEDEVNLDDAADLGNTMDSDDDDDDMEVIASVDDEDAAAATPPEDEGAEEAPAEEEPEHKKKKKKGDEASSEGEGEEEGEGEGEEEGSEENAPEGEEGSEEKPKKKKHSGEKKHSLLKDIGGGLAGKKKDEVTEGQVVKVDFTKGKGVDNPGIEVPKGYDRFEANGKVIVGFKGDKRHVISTTSDPKLAQELVKIYNGGKASTTIKPLSMLQAFGSREMAAADEAGIKLTEKPSYWDDFEGDGYAVKNNLDEVKLKRLEKTVGKLKTYSGKDIYGTDTKPRGPLAKVAKMPDEDMFIVKFDDGSRYVADQTGANTYIRMWQKIN